MYNPAWKETQVSLKPMGKLEAGARELGLVLTAEHLAQFQTYYEDLVEWNRKFNLTTVIGYEEVQLRHFLDALTCLLAMPGWASDVVGNQLPFVCKPQPWLLLDVGAGAGFPGLPLKIVCPELKLTLLEATRKKVEFLLHLVDHLGLSDVEVVWDRAEVLGQKPHYRERYDVVTARAVAELPVLAELCLPFCRVGGRLIAQKGPEAPAEVEAARGAIERLGGAVRELKQVSLPGQREHRILIVVDKAAPTPSQYPRRPGIPNKRPLTAG
jgi:16S rRNA (guanine527-N7)-methyltransferase